MVEPARFSPEQLDRIEDALESLEADVAISDPTPEVRGVLESYREILQESRHAIPMVEPPPGVLAAVFAEARAATDAPAASLAPEPAAAKPSFFARFRRSFLIPSLALAGTAALVLWISRPQDGEVTLDDPVAAKAPTPAANAPATPAEPADRPEKAQAIAAPAEPAREAAAEPEPDPEAVEEEEPVAADEAPAPPAASSAAMPSQAPGAAVGGADKKLDALDDGTTRGNKQAAKDAWGRVERADRARESGDCAAARSDYLVATEDDIPAVRARAYAGLGLCNVQDGDDAGSVDAFERARGIDPTIDKFIAAEREPSGTYRPAPKSKRRAKKSKSPSKPASKPKSADRQNAAPASPFSP